MSRDAVVEKVFEIADVVFDRSVPRDSPFARADIDEWDSLRHIEFLLTVEEVLGVQFPESALGDLDSVDGIAAEVMRQYAA